MLPSLQDMDLVEHHRARVKELKAKYEQAIAIAEMACAEMQAVDLPGTDGSLAYRNALKAERQAANNYTKALLDLDELFSANRE